MDYPANWERTGRTRDGVEFHIRPIRADDEGLDRQFIAELSPESRYMRMMSAIKDIPEELMYPFVHVDYLRNMAFVALAGEPPAERVIGVARYCADSTGSDAEFAVAVSDQWQARGVGATLTKLLFEYATVRGIHRLHGDVFTSNARMLDLVHFLGMQTHICADDQALTEAECPL